MEDEPQPQLTRTLVAVGLFIVLVWIGAMVAAFAL